MPVLLLFLLVFLSPSVWAQADLENYYNYNTRAAQPTALQAAAEKTEPKMDGAKRHVVTSVQKCFEEIGPEAAAKIRSRSLTPYADCQKALREKAAEDAKKAESEDADSAETPRNFKRVSETPPDEEPNDKAPDTPKTGKKAKKAVK
jgi:hypothetical protein